MFMFVWDFMRIISYIFKGYICYKNYYFHKDNFKTVFFLVFY